jgi:3-deoxy-manno-octulosonate cytidylyltransferase (CMP-KDO synthetase)
MATLATPIRDEAEWRSPHVVKVAVGLDGRALYFSRSPIPHDRDGRRSAGEPVRAAAHRHVRLSARRASCGSPRCRRRRSSCGSARAARALEHGIAIGVVEWTGEPVIEVDTAADLEQARAALGEGVTG